MDDDDDDLFMTTLIDRYAARPDNLENLCLAQFAANYDVKYGEKENDDDIIPDQLDTENGDKQSKTIILKKGLGKMTKRQKECVIRMHRYNREKNPEKFYLGELMLFLPWRNGDLDIIAGYPNYATRYRAEHIMEMEAKYSKCAQTLDEVAEEFNQYGSPEHAWHNLEPTAEQGRMEAEND